MVILIFHHTLIFLAMAERLIVIGGGAAGMSLASRVRRLRSELDIVVFERSGYVSYAPCGLPYYVGGEIDSSDKLVYYTAEFFKEKRNIDVHLHAEVTNIDPSARTVTVVEGGKEKVWEWDWLAIATGAKPVKPPIDGIDLHGIYTLRNVEDGIRLKEALERVERIVVVGGGYIGVEVAEGLVKAGKRVTLVEMLPHVLPNMDGDVVKPVEEELRRNGVDLRLNERVVAFEGGERVEKVVTEESVYRADAVVLAVGVKPEVELARKAGIRLGETGAIDVSKRLKTNIDRIYAVGDAVETWHLVTGEKVWIPLAHTANKMGYVAGTNIAGGNMRFPGVVGTAFTKAFNLHIARTGLTEREAREKGFNVITAKIEARTRAHYYPGGGKLHLKVVADADTGKLLGAQAVGTEGVTGRINTVAVLLKYGGKVKDLFFSDLGYAPPFGPVWDPLVIAARVLLRQMS